MRSMVLWSVLPAFALTASVVSLAYAQERPQYSPWAKVCARVDGAPRPVCMTGREGQSAGTTAIGAFLIDAPGPQGPILRVQTSLVARPDPALRVGIDGEMPLTLPYTACYAHGCVADIAADERLRQRLRTGTALKIRAVSVKGPTLNYEIPLAGFAAAHDQPPSEAARVPGTTFLANPQLLLSPPLFRITADEVRLLSHSPWRKICLKQTNEVCFTGTDAKLPSRLVVVMAVLIEPRSNNEPKLVRVTLPLGVRLAGGVRLGIDQRSLKARYVACMTNGCIADFDATADLLRRLRQAEAMTVDAVTAAGQTFSVSVPLSGFAAAADGPSEEVSQRGGKLSSDTPPSLGIPGTPARR